MSKFPSLASMTEAELSALASKLAGELTTLGQAYARDVVYQRHIRLAERRRKVVAAKNSTKYHRLAIRHQSVEEALTRLRRQATNQAEERRVQAVESLPTRIRVWYAAGGYARRKEDVVWYKGDRFVMIRKPAGRAWAGIGAGMDYVPVRYHLYDLKDHHPNLIWNWEGRLTREAIHNVEATIVKYLGEPRQVGGSACVS